MKKVGLNFDEDKFRIVTKDIQKRTKVLSDVPERVDFLFKNEITRDIPSMFKKGIDKEKAILVLDTAKTFFENEEDFSLENSKKLEEDIYAKFHELGFHMGGSFGVLRIAVTGKAVTPPFIDSIIALGKKVTIKRIEDAKREVNQYSHC